MPEQSEITSFPVTCAAEMTLIAPTALTFPKETRGSWCTSFLSKEVCGLFAKRSGSKTAAASKEKEIKLKREDYSLPDTDKYSINMLIKKFADVA